MTDAQKQAAVELAASYRDARDRAEAAARDACRGAAAAMELLAASAPAVPPDGSPDGAAECRVARFKFGRALEEMAARGDPGAAPLRRRYEALTAVARMCGAELDALLAGDEAPAAEGGAQ